MENFHLMQTSLAPIWSTSLANDLRRLFNGVGTRMPTGTNTMDFIPKRYVPCNKMPTYGRLICDICQHKAESHCTRITIGGNLIDYPGDKSTSTANLTAIECLLNSTISNPNAKFCTTDIIVFYLSTALKDYEYMKLRLEIIPDKIISQYNLPNIADDGWLYCEIKKGMCGLPHAGNITIDRLIQHLVPYRYVLVKYKTRLW